MFAMVRWSMAINIRQTELLTQQIQMSLLWLFHSINLLWSTLCACSHLWFVYKHMSLDKHVRLKPVLEIATSAAF